MGEVFAAHDPELDRVVAVKVLRPELAGRSPEARARFQREAQALARVKHPNVVAVYDVGLVDDHVFVAMELVEGQTLAAWLAEAPRGWREVVDVFLHAGRGLEAAHAAGLVHRDFKPSNVMIGDRVCVVDFGLARPALVRGEPPATSTAPPMLEGTITHTGETLGTPAYMAPEQREGATQLSDQYSFAVALHEALFGARPGRLAPTPARVVPARIRAVVDRALSLAPEARYPSMHELLVDLARDPARTRRRWLLGAAGVATVIAAIGLARTTAAPVVCTDAEARLAGIWDPARKSVLAAAFAATRRPYAGAAWAQLGDNLDRYTRAWVDMHTETCRATRIEGRQSDRLMDLRMACLERRRAVLAALTDLWSRGVDPGAVHKVSDVAANLPSLDECADTRALTDRTPLPLDPVQQVKIAAARAQLDRGRALSLAGRLPDARAAIEAARPAIDAIAWPQVRAEAMLLEANVLRDLGEQAAETRFLDTARLAGEAHDGRLYAEALIDLVDHAAYDQQRASYALAIADLADGALALAGEDERLRVRLMGYRADALTTAGRHDEAQRALQLVHERARTRLGAGDRLTLGVQLKLGQLASIRGDNAEARKLFADILPAAAELYGAQHPRVATILIFLGNVTQNVGDFAGAADYYRRALAILETTEGSDAPSTTAALQNLGAMEIQLNHLAQAEPLLERARELRERKLGPDHPHVALTLGNLAMLRRKQARFAESLALAERALAINTKSYGPSHRNVAFSLDRIAEVQGEIGRAEQAIETHRRALEIRKTALGNDHPLTRGTTVNLADALAHDGRCRDARPLLAALTPDDLDRPSAPHALAVLGRCDFDERRFAPAIARLEPALARLDQRTDNPRNRGEHRWRLARALRAVGRRDEAIAAALRAEPDLAMEPAGAKSLAEVRRWLRDAGSTR